MTRAVIHHSVHGTHWLDAAALRSAIADREPTAEPAVAHTRGESETLLADAEVLLTSYLEPELLEAASSLRWIQALSAGVDTLDLDRLEERGILLTSAAGAHAQPIAEQVLGYMLVFERRLDRAIESRRRGVWERFEGGELCGRTLGVVGLGSIGVRTAELAAAVGMEVIGTKRDPDVEIDAVDRIYGSGELEAVLTEAEYLLVCCPLTAETEGLIGRTALGALPDDAVVMNVARGEVVDEPALIDALQQRTIRGAALDVFATEPLPTDSTLWELSNVILTPHNAGSSPRLPGRLADVFVENRAAYLAGEPGRMRNRVL